jgi:hypothetical protein
MSDTIIQQSLFTTADLALAATITLWYPLDSIDQTNPQKSYFNFKREDELDQLIEQYWRGEIRIEPKAYFSALRVLKVRLHENRFLGRG